MELHVALLPAIPKYMQLLNRAKRTACHTETHLWTGPDAQPVRQTHFKQDKRTVCQTDMASAVSEGSGVYCRGVVLSKMQVRVGAGQQQWGHAQQPGAHPPHEAGGLLQKPGCSPRYASCPVRLLPHAQASVPLTEPITRVQH